MNIRCIGCRKCIKACPRNALLFSSHCTTV
ncbi:MAG TPA: 4Fe-4S binding protein [Clostridiales bacterium]|nr:4Fe-4S binding protein [Clostridiales bacterium]